MMTPRTLPCCLALCPVAVMEHEEKDALAYPTTKPKLLDAAAADNMLDLDLPADNPMLPLPGVRSWWPC